MHIHDENLVHRDLKPANVLLSAAPSGGGEVNAKVADVGLARAVRGSHKGNTRVMRASKSQGAGTITYMAPEQIEAGRITQKVDVFAFGILMNELETGVMPWDDMPDMREWPSFFCPPPLDLGHEGRVPTRCALWFRPPSIGSRLGSHVQDPGAGGAQAEAPVPRRWRQGWRPGQTMLAPSPEATTGDERGPW